MTPAPADAVLDRLVAQFASPYDFLRELVQNAMDAGSDRVEVWLRRHPVGDEGRVVFELGVADAGHGMDEAVIDDKFTRLFATSKAGDRTMAGGYGVGFVSVFAWEPMAVVVHTGRDGQAWELEFAADRTFVKRPVDEPLEGTTITLLRPGQSDEGDAIAEAIRDALWRWTRYCPLEISFDDEADGRGPELIQDAPDTGLDAAALQVEDGTTRLRVAYGAPAEATLLRRGLILAEGPVGTLLPAVAEAIGPALAHLRVFLDSPHLRTTIARDKVVDGEGFARLQQRVVEVAGALREQLLSRLETLCAAPRWGELEAEQYAHLHSHRRYEDGQLTAAAQRRPLLRGLDGRTWSIEALRAAVGADAALPVGVVAAARVAPPEPLWTGAIPLLWGDAAEDAAWLAPWVARAGLRVEPPDELFGWAEPVTEAAAPVAANALWQVLAAAGVEVAAVRFAVLRPLAGRAPRAAPLLGVELPTDAASPAAVDVEGTARTLVLIGGELPRAALRGRTIWVHARHPLVVGLGELRDRAGGSRFALTTWALALAGRCAPAPGAAAVDQERFAAAVERVIAEVTP